VKSLLNRLAVVFAFWLTLEVVMNVLPLFALVGSFSSAESSK